MKKKICMVTTSEIFHDTRILNEAEVLAKKYDLTIVAKRYPGQTDSKKRAFKIKLAAYRKVSSRLNVFAGQWALMRAAFRQNPDVYHAHDIDGLLCSFPAALAKRKVLIYDSHELWSKNYPFANLRGIQPFLGPLERFLMLKVKEGITVNQSIAGYLSKKYHKSFWAIHNYSVEKSSSKGLSLRKLFPGKKIVLHLGSADEGRGLEEIIHSAQNLPAKCIIIFLGGGKTEKEAKLLVSKLGLNKKVFFLPAVPPEEIKTSIKEADLGLALTQNKSLSYYFSLPNKLFQYISAGVPVLGSDFPEFRKVILSNKIGLTVDPSNPKKVAGKIVQALSISNQKHFRSNLKKIGNKYSFTKEGQNLVKFYQSILNDSKEKN